MSFCCQELSWRLYFCVYHMQALLVIKIAVALFLLHWFYCTADFFLHCFCSIVSIKNKKIKNNVGFLGAITPSEHKAHYMKQNKWKKNNSFSGLCDRPLVLSLSPSLSLPKNATEIKFKKNAHILLEEPNWWQLSYMFVFGLFVALKKGIPSKICILSCFAQLKSILFNLLCVCDHYMSYLYPLDFDDKHQSCSVFHFCWCHNWLMLFYVLFRYGERDQVSILPHSCPSPQHGHCQHAGRLSVCCGGWRLSCSHALLVSFFS